MKGTRNKKLQRYDDTKQPPFFLPAAWRDSPLALAQQWGRITYNGACYVVDEATGDLCRLDVLTARRATQLKIDVC